MQPLPTSAPSALGAAPNTRGVVLGLERWMGTAAQPLLLHPPGCVGGVGRKRRKAEEVWLQLLVSLNKISISDTILACCICWQPHHLRSPNNFVTCGGCTHRSMRSHFHLLAPRYSQKSAFCLPCSRSCSHPNKHTSSLASCRVSMQARFAPNH